MPATNQILLTVSLVTVLFTACSKKKMQETPTQAVIPSVTIGSQIWMKANLSVDKYRNGDPIPEIKDPAAFMAAKTGAWCYYNNDTALGRVYGKLYNWYAVDDARGLAPEGWHVPTDAEWTTLTDGLGGTAVAGGKMKEAGTAHWDAPNIGADNSSGFTALGAGDTFSSMFAHLRMYTYWWTTTTFTSGNSAEKYALQRMLTNSGASIGRSGTSLYNGFSVRCVKN